MVNKYRNPFANELLYIKNVRIYWKTKRQFIRLYLVLEPELLGGSVATPEVGEA